MQVKAVFLLMDMFNAIVLLHFKKIEEQALILSLQSILSIKNKVKAYLRSYSFIELS